MKKQQSPEGVVIRGEYLSARTLWARGGKIGSTAWCRSVLVEVLDLEKRGSPFAAKLLLKQAFGAALDSKTELNRKTLKGFFRAFSDASQRPEKAPDLESFRHGQYLFVFQAFEILSFGDGVEPTKHAVEQKAKRLSAIRYLATKEKIVLPNVPTATPPVQFDRLLKFSPSEERMIEAQSKHWRALVTADWKRCALSYLKNGGGGRPKGARNRI